MLSLSSKNWLNYSLGVILSLGILSVASVTSAQSTTDNVNPLPEENSVAPMPEENTVTPMPEENTVTPINQTESLLSLQGGEKLMQKKITSNHC